MFIEERHEAIMKLLNKNGKINVKDLSQMFEVSESMIRKDLQALEKQGRLKRTYGGAIRTERMQIREEHFIQRVQVDTSAKVSIAQKAFDLITDGDIIFLDVSSTCYLLAELLLASTKKITIITNMPILASMMKTNSIQQFVFIGGDYSPAVAGNIGFHAIEQIGNYRCGKAFMGCVGIDLSDGSVTVSNSEDAYTKKAITKISKERYLLFPNSYFDRDGLHQYSNIDEYQGLITESTPEKRIAAMLDKYDIQLL